MVDKMAEVVAEVVAEAIHGNGGETGRGGAFGYLPMTGKAYETLAQKAITYQS